MHDPRAPERIAHGLDEIIASVATATHCGAELWCDANW
jgi:hypothetical protein